MVHFSKINSCLMSKHHFEIKRKTAGSEEPAVSIFGFIENSLRKEYQYQ